MNRRSLLLCALTAPLVLDAAFAQEDEFGGGEQPEASAGKDMRRYRCTVSDHIYDPAEGDPAAGVAAGTAFADLPADWVCPDCGASRSDFEPID